MSVADEISRRLSAAFQPTHLSVEDVSWQHAGPVSYTHLTLPTICSV